MGLLNRFRKKRERREKARAAELATRHAHDARRAIEEHEQLTGERRRDLVVVLREERGEIDLFVSPRPIAIECMPDLASLTTPPEPPSFSLLVGVGDTVQSYDVEETSRPEVLHG